MSKPCAGSVRAQGDELAAARAGLMAKALEIEKLKLQIARLRRQQYGRSSEKIAPRARAVRAEAGGAGGGGSRRPWRTARSQSGGGRDGDPGEDREVRPPASAGASAAARDRARAGLRLPELRRRPAQGRRGRHRDPRLHPRPLRVIRHVRPALLLPAVREHGAGADAVAADRARPAGRRAPGPRPRRQVLRSPAALPAIRHLCPRGCRSRPRHPGRLGRQGRRR